MRVALLLLAACAVEPEPSTLYITDYRADAILAYDGVTGEFLGTFAHGSDQRVDRPAGVRLGPDQHLYTAGFGRGEIVRYDVPSGQMMGVFYGDTALLEEPVELVFHGDELVVLGNDTNNVVVVGPDGALVRTFGYPLIRRAHDFVIDDAGRVLVATEPAIQIWDLATGAQLGEAGRGELVFATSIALAGGLIYVADWERDQVLAFAANGAYLGVAVDGLVDPISIDFDAGELVVLDATGVSRFDARTGDRRAHLVARDDRLRYPRGFTFARD